MSKYENLKIFERDNTITASKLRLIGYIPATVYGKEFQPVSIQVKAHEFELAIARGVKNFTLDGLGKTVDVEVKQLQKNNSKRAVIHIEFFVPSGADTQNSKSQAKATAAKSEKAPEPAASSATEEDATARVEEAVPAH